MSESLRDQLLKAGLRPSKPKNKPAPRTSPKKKLQKKQAPAPSAPPVLSAEEKAARKEKNQAIRLFLRENKLNKKDAEIAYYFQMGNKATHLYVTEEQQKQLAAGELLIAYRNERHYLLKPEHVQQLHELDKDIVIYDASKQDDKSDSSDDPFYEQFKIPDDLDW